MDKVKVIFTIICSTISSLIGNIGIPFAILICSNIIDYMTAFLACYVQGTKFTSYKSFKGVAKKILMWLLVIVGAIIDISLSHIARNFVGQPTVSYIVANLVAYWLICNELLSILENIAGAGVAYPKFLSKIIKATQTKIEKKGEENDYSRENK